MFNSTIWFLFILAIGFTACQPKETEEINPSSNNEYLVGNRLVGEYTASQISSRLFGMDELLGVAATYPVRVHRIVYKTPNADSTMLEASGALIIPGTGKIRGVVSLQHGTIVNDNDAPSNYRRGSEAYSYGSALASAGYVVVCPDYIGYGASKNVPHPYEHRQTLASASLNMLRASREFLRANNVPFEKLFISGYSEGGFATMSMQKMLEEKFPGEFPLTASTCGAGAYHKSRFMSHVINETTAGQADFNRSYVWVLLTYDRLYKLNRPAGFYFKEPYAAEVQARQSGANVAVSLNTTFTEGFRKGIMDGSDTGFIKAVKDNDVHDWKPQTPTRLYHGDADQYVFYFNSESALAAMQKRGAAQVELVRLPGHNHETGVLEYAKGTFDFFARFSPAK